MPASIRKNDKNKRIYVRIMQESDKQTKPAPVPQQMHGLPNRLYVGLMPKDSIR